MGLGVGGWGFRDFGFRASGLAVQGFGVLSLGWGHLRLWAVSRVEGLKVPGLRAISSTCPEPLHSILGALL